MYNAFYPAAKAKKADGQAAGAFSEIVIRVAGQAQAGDNSTAHLGAYSYMQASDSVQDHLNFTQLMTMLNLKITLPEAATPTSLVLRTPDGYLLYSIMYADGTTAKVAAKEQTLALSGITNATSLSVFVVRSFTSKLPWGVAPDIPSTKGLSFVGR